MLKKYRRNLEASNLQSQVIVLKNLPNLHVYAICLEQAWEFESFQLFKHVLLEHQQR